MDSTAAPADSQAPSWSAIPESRPSEEAPVGNLSELEEKILEFERAWWKYAGAKEQAIADLFGMSATRYFQALNTLLDKPDALAAHPLLIKRLRRQRTERQQQRSARRVSAAG